MQITLDAVAERIINQKIASGHFPSADEVVNAALRLLDELHRRKLEELRRELAIGIDQAVHGELIDGEAVFRRHRARMGG